MSAEAGHVAMIATALLSWTGTVAARPRFSAVVAGTVVLAAMIDSVVGIVPPVGWTAALVASAVAIALGTRRDGRDGTMGLHRACSTIVIAALLLLAHPEPAGGAVGSAAHPHASGLAGFTAALVAGQLALSVIAIGRQIPARTARANAAVVEVVAMGGCSALMLIG